MSEPQDDGVPWDIREAIGSIDSLAIEHLVSIAPFPVYGLLEYPSDLSLQGFGYSTADSNLGKIGVPWQPNQPQFLWQASLHYDYLPPHQRTGQRIELSTTDTNPPIPMSFIEAQRPDYEARYQSHHDVPLMAEQATSFVIEHFPFLDGTAVATIEYAPQAPAMRRGRLLGSQVHHMPDPHLPDSRLRGPISVAVPPSVGPVWSFTLRGPELWVTGTAYGWTQHELFDLLGRLGAISQRPSVLAQYQRELAAWQRIRQLG